jgi:polar amino acid transport system permease protein
MWGQVLHGIPRQLLGLVSTCELTLMALAMGTLIGIAGGIGIVYGPLWVRWLFRAYSDVIRGIPVLVIIFGVFYGTPMLGGQIDAFDATVLALGVFVGAYIVEIVRGGITTIARAQSEAAKAIGLTFAQRLRYVILPQAFRRMLPPWVNAAVDLVKATSLVSLIGVPDLLLQTQQLTSRTLIVLPFYATAAVLYFALNYSLSRISRYFERRNSYFR